MNLLSKLYHSTAGFQAYRHFIRESTGKAVLYLLLLTLVLGVIWIIGPVNDFNHGISEMIQSFDREVPNFTFQNGELNVEGEMPIIIEDSTSVLIIDTSGRTDETILNNYDQAVLITRHKMIQKDYIRNQVVDFSALQGLRMDKSDVKRFLPFLRWIAALIAFFGVLFFVATKFLSALVLSLFGLIINSARNTRLPYRDVFKISVYAMTLPLILGTLLDLLPIWIPYLALIFYVISGVYIWGAINMIRKDRDSAELPPEPPVQ